MQQTDKTLRGVALMLTFCVIAPLIDVASKLAAAEVTVGVVTLSRFVVQAALMLPVALIMKESLALPRGTFWLSVARAVVSILATFCFIAALRFMPIADALVIVFVEPFIILLIGWLVLGEHVGPRRLIACLVGFLGSIVVIRPSFAVFGSVALFPLGTALFFAIYILITRSLSRQVHPVPMQFHTAFFAAILCMPLFLLGPALNEPSLNFIWPQGIFWLWCFFVGLAATISHMAMTYALKYAPSSTLAPLHYSEIVTATIFSYMVFGDFPDLIRWVGIAIIVGSGLYIIAREHKLAKAANRPLKDELVLPEAP
jgi:drug/metabolite transporter (DMT)-like permease